MNEQLIPIGKAAKLLGVSLDTLRRWEKSNILVSLRPTPTSHRYYRQSDIENFLTKGKQTKSQNPAELAKQWVTSVSPIPLDSSLYCQTSDIFAARLSRLQTDLERISELKNIFPLIIAVAGEIGNNSYNHNLGNWPDVMGTFFGYDLSNHQVVLADRGQGIYETLLRVRPEINDDQQALKIAFTEYISGRAPESRGNGLKFVRDVIMNNRLQLHFFTHNTVLNLTNRTEELNIQKIDMPFHGCLAIINY